MEVTINVEQDPVTPSELKRWSETSPYFDTIYPVNEAHRSPYRHNQKLNHRIILWSVILCVLGNAHPICAENQLIKSVYRQGDITSISVDAVVHSINRNLSDKNSITRRLFLKIGPEFRHELFKIVKG